MPRAILTFRLPQEREEHQLALDAGKLHCVLWDLDQHLRSKVKYGSLPPEVEKIYQEVRDEFYSLLSEYEVTLS